MFKSIICWFKQHRYYVVEEFSEWSRKIQCERCGKKWAMNDNIRALIEWDSEFEKFYSDPAFRKLVDKQDERGE